MDENWLQPYKVVVLGTDSVENITFLGAISEIAILSVYEHFKYPTNFGRFTFYDEEERQRSLFLFSPFGIPDFAKTDFWLRLVEGFLGVVLIVDSSSSSTFPQARESLMKLRGRGFLFPIVIAANKQDLEDAWPPDAIELFIAAKTLDIPVVPCVAKNPQSVAAVLIKLAEEYIKAWELERLPNRNTYTDSSDWRFK
jgi:signal recognition particle receptor subunit beta